MQEGSLPDSRGQPTMNNDDGATRNFDMQASVGDEGLLAKVQESSNEFSIDQNEDSREDIVNLLESSDVKGTVNEETEEMKLKAKQIPSKPKVDRDPPQERFIYRDFSRVSPVSQKKSSFAPLPSSTVLRVQKLPSKLNSMLSDPEIQHIISWMPHGRSWKVHNPHLFIEEVAPRYFEYTNYNSFIRLVNAWGFRRVMKGTDRNSYYHELFLRGITHLHTKMRRLTPADKKHPVDPDDEPDFYKLPALPLDSSSEEISRSIAQHQQEKQESKQERIGSLVFHRQEEQGIKYQQKSALDLALDSSLRDTPSSLIGGNGAISANAAASEAHDTTTLPLDLSIRDRIRTGSSYAAGGTLSALVVERLMAGAGGPSFASGAGIPTLSRIIPGRIGGITSDSTARSLLNPLLLANSPLPSFQPISTIRQLRQQEREQQEARLLQISSGLGQASIGYHASINPGSSIVSPTNRNLLLGDDLQLALLREADARRRRRLLDATSLATITEPNLTANLLQPQSNVSATEELLALIAERQQCVRSQQGSEHGEESIRQDQGNK